MYLPTNHAITRTQSRYTLRSFATRTSIALKIKKFGQIKRTAKAVLYSLRYYSLLQIVIELTDRHDLLT